MMKILISLLPVLSVLAAFTNAAWGQIAPQDRPTMPNPIVRESPAMVNEPPLPQPRTREPLPHPPLDGRFGKNNAERRREIEAEVETRWREIFGVGPVEDTKTVRLFLQDDACTSCGG